MADALTLTSRDYTARIPPFVGGGLAYLQWRGRDLPQHYPQECEDMPNPELLGCFPMVPFAGRVRDQAFAWREATYQTRPHPSAPHSLHGDGWISAWKVEDASDTRAQLSLTCAQHPLGFDAHMIYALGDDGLRLTTTITNQDERPMPFGLGHHPWFPREKGAQVQFGARRFWLEAPGGFPSQSIAIPPELDHAQGLDMPQAWRNNCYEGWDGELVIYYPQSGHAVTMTADAPLDWLMVYANPDLPYVCFEPQTHLPAAHNMPGDGPRYGLIELAPGESLTGSLHIAATNIA